jgi:formylglycine-generating enzyme required for sulfatase activity
MLSAMRLGPLAPAVCALLLVSSAGASERRGDVVRVEHERPSMVRVPAGPFSMGPSLADKLAAVEQCAEELPDHWYCTMEYLRLDKLEQREVYVSSFAIDRHEVTAAEFRRCVAGGGCDVAALVAGDERYLRDEWPMVNVTWQDAADYCAWAGKRLPTEAEWEKAARGGDGRAWPWGHRDRVDGANHGTGEVPAMTATHSIRFGWPNLDYRPDDRDGYLYAAPPGSLRWGRSPYGLYDMAGNVSEWVADYWSDDGYAGLPAIDPRRDVPPPGGAGHRVVRGGSWAEPKFFSRTYVRNLPLPSAGPPRAHERSPSRGFRCARDVP